MDKFGRKTTGGRDRRKDILPSRLRRMSEVESAWVGAFIEADGCVSWNSNAKDSRWQVSVYQVDPEPISTLLRLVGTGAVYWAQSRHPYLVWMLYRVAEVADIARQCGAYCPKLRKVPQNG